MESPMAQSLDGLDEGAGRRSRSTLYRWLEACRPWLLGRARARLPRKLAPKDDASDLVQRVLLRATTEIDRFRGQGLGQFHAWLARMLDTQMLKRLRHWRQQRRNVSREELLNPAFSAQGELAAASTSVSDRLVREEELEQLRLAASWCREQDRTVIFLHFFEGRSHKEIADRLGIAPAAVRQRHNRVVRRLRAAMHLLNLMNRRGLSTVQQDVIGLHQFQGADSRQIAHRLRLPEDLVAQWTAEAQPFLRSVAEDLS
jgi:RNA polymerase sigma-70 factor (ECF subfamily)